MTTSLKLAASFRDPSGFIFQRNGRLFRQINRVHQEHYDHLIASGLYAALTDKGLLIRHEEVDEKPHQPLPHYKIIKPQPVPFISYPYEWSFGELKDAGLLTLAVQRRALEFGMFLKDASAYNVQYVGCRPIFIDTLSFEKYVEGEPWVAYRQFCQHFLAPLALMSYRDVRLNQLLQTNLDGIPLDLASALLPLSSRLKLGLLLHVHLHARAEKTFGARTEKPKKGHFSRQALLGLIESLESALKKMRWQPAGTQWIGYYDDTGYAPGALAKKKQVVAELLDHVRPHTVWDLGANTGVFSRIASDRGAVTIAFDIDPACVEQNYREGSQRREENLLPLLLDFSAPSPSIGWRNQERISLAARGPADLVLALGLIHHLAIGENLPLESIAEYLATLCRWLLIEFVPKSDPQVSRLLVTRKDIFGDYSAEHFEQAFGRYFSFDRCHHLVHSKRSLYLMRRKEDQ